MNENETFEPNIQNDEPYIEEPISMMEYESTRSIDNSIDYSSYFENLQSIGIIICAILIGSAISICFFKGLGK